MLASICGHFDIVKLLINSSNETWTAEAMNGYLDIVKLLHNLDNGPSCSTEDMDGAANNGHFEIVQFLHENQSEGCTSNALYGAIQNGYPKIVGYLLTHQQEHDITSASSSIDYLRIRHHQISTDKDYRGVLQTLHRHSFPHITEYFVCTAILTLAIIYYSICASTQDASNDQRNI
ncbi:hypothetical protein THRCLA_09679 [Thraustotheca clavata]|uniref:Uncharacterized protein n=1 Tax=Thraustotheca clavata TaxID=74557 RepID=A0A1V9YUT6_9STRA|nr:hypothetical protein THRCLA_09679 [Thraustotheca clavata]